MFTDQSLLQRFHFLESYPAVALAVSGGADSLAMLYLVAQWQSCLKRRVYSAQAESQIQKIPKIHVLSVDHGLRKAGAEEAKAVVGQAKELGFQAQVLVWEGESPKTSVQEKARNARYWLCGGYCVRHDISIMLTAHQREDQVETFLMRLARGSGVDGLSSIGQQVRMKGLIVCRPLLDVGKQELKDYLSALDVQWAEDPSNENCDYERVRVRQNIGVLESLNIGGNAVALSVQRLARARKALEFSAMQLYHDEVLFDPAPLFSFRQDVLENVPEELVIRLLGIILAKMPFSAKSPELAKVERLVSALREGETVVGCLACCEIIVSGGHVYIYPERGRMSDEDSTVILEKGRAVVWGRCLTVTLQRDLEGAVTARALGKKAFAPLRGALSDSSDVPEWMRCVPSSVGATFLSFWMGRQLLAVPSIGYYATSCDRHDFLLIPAIKP